MTPRSSRGRRLVLAAVVALAALLAACGSGNGQNTLEPKGEAARKIDSLLQPVVFLAVIPIAILVLAGTVFVAVKFRYRPGVNENPKQTHGHSKLEITWTVIPALILAAVAVPTVSTIFQLAEDPGPQALQVEVVGKQWWWQFRYNEAKVVTANELVIPAGRKVHLTLRACDPTLPAPEGGTIADGSVGCNVIHSFWPAELAGKRDVVPGHDNKLTISADKPGVYLGQCAEYCGLAHADMRFRVIAKSSSDFEDWLTEQQSGPAEPVIDEESGQPFPGTPELFATKYACTNCHVFDDSSGRSYGPNLTHLASRTTFASGVYKLNRANLVKWLLDAPSMVPMESEHCREGLGTGTTCVGMPSFTKNTPKGQPTMTQADAEEMADFLLGQE